MTWTRKAILFDFIFPTFIKYKSRYCSLWHGRQEPSCDWPIEIMWRTILHNKFHQTNAYIDEEWQLCWHFLFTTVSYLNMVSFIPAKYDKTEPCSIWEKWSLLNMTGLSSSFPTQSPWTQTHAGFGGLLQEQNTDNIHLSQEGSEQVQTCWNAKSMQLLKSQSI